MKEAMMQPYKLVHTGDFIRRARQLGVELKFNTKSSGLQIHWNYEGDPKAIKNVRRVFQSEGLIANHRFSRKRSL